MAIKYFVMLDEPIVLGVRSLEEKCVLMRTIPQKKRNCVFEKSLFHQNWALGCAWNDPWDAPETALF